MFMLLSGRQGLDDNLSIDLSIDLLIDLSINWWQAQRLKADDWL
jgi:hypothetical protein